MTPRKLFREILLTFPSIAFLLIVVPALLLLTPFMRKRLTQKDAPPVYAPAAPPAVLTGLENLTRQNFAPLQGKRVGLITNPTGVDSHLRANIDILFHASGIKLVALFGPEHGVRGDAGAGDSVGNARDAETGLPVYSLYGKTRKPTMAMLRGVDALVFDIQDIGSRSYTYISTLGLCMEAAADARIPFFVLDRPNPLGGERVEGNIPTPAYFSFVGRYAIPYAHGLTVGELAQMINGEGWLGGRHCDLTVIPLKNWTRGMEWRETGLPWVPSSPHIPHAETSLYYAATGIMGEQPTLNIGVGYTLPFEMAGAPGLSPEKMARQLNRRKLPGVWFRPASWVPFYAAYKEQTCGGVQIYFTDPAKVPLTRLNFEIMDAARKLKPSLNFFPAGREREFDLVCGTDEVRRMFQAGKPAAEIWKFWNAGSEKFRQQRKPYLLYPDATPIVSKGIITLTGAAAAYYWYNQHKNPEQNKEKEPYYISKATGRIYYRDSKTHQAHWITPPQGPIEVSENEAKPYKRFKGYNNQTTGDDLSDVEN